MAILRESLARNPHLGTIEERRLARGTGLNPVQVSEWVSALRIDAGFGFKRISHDRARVLREYIHIDETPRELKRRVEKADQSGLCHCCCWGPRYARAQYGVCSARALAINAADSLYFAYLDCPAHANLSRSFGP